MRVAGGVAAWIVAPLAVLALVTAANAVEIEVQEDSISGRVFDSSSGRGVPGLSVRLIAPKSAKLPVRITRTSGNGAFEFRNLTMGKYLLAIYSGTTLVFRREIDTRRTTTFTVPLKPVPRTGTSLSSD